jgi:hypothetical protein
MSAKHVNLLKAALRHLPGDELRGICYALTDETEGQPIEAHEPRWDIVGWIDGALDGCVYLTGWLKKQGYDIHMLDDAGIRKIQATRKAWMLWMIDNHTIFDKKGKS